jgi:hypothetical protein
MQPQDVTRVLKTAVGANRDLRPQGFRRFTAQIAEPMDEAALSQRPGKTGLNGADQSGGAVSNDPRWTPENRPVVDGAKPASESAAPSTSVLPRSIVIEQAPSRR